MPTKVAWRHFCYLLYEFSQKNETFACLAFIWRTYDFSFNVFSFIHVRMICRSFWCSGLSTRPACGFLGVQIPPAKDPTGQTKYCKFHHQTLGNLQV